MSDENEEEYEICDLMTDDCKAGLAMGIMAQVADWVNGHGKTLDDQAINDIVRETLKSMADTLPTPEVLKQKFDAYQAAMDAHLGTRGPKN